VACVKKFVCKELLVEFIYRVIKKALCTWRLQYNHQMHRGLLISLYLPLPVKA